MPFKKSFCSGCRNSNVFVSVPFPSFKHPVVVLLISFGFQSMNSAAYIPSGKCKTVTCEG